ncbi:MAG: proton-conducting transporter membrane subunit, partial [Rhodospirillales bacterium]
MKKLIAYSSVAHMGFVTIGIFVFNTQGVQGAIYQMLSHGVVSAALFLCVGVLYDRIHSREIARYGGLVHRMPKYALVFMVFTLSTLALPGLSGFVGEMLVLVGTFAVNTWVAVLASTGLFLGAAYSLYLYRKLIFGELTKPELKSIVDLEWREVAIFVPLIAVTIWMGVYPSSFLDVIAPSVEKLVSNYQAAVGATKAAMLSGQ